MDRAKFDAYAAAGVNRLSFGVQSMRAHVLASLGRTHDPANVTKAVEWARAAGFTRINLDLIYGSPGESVDDWRATLDAALALEPAHVSAYALTVEPGTPLGRAVAAGERPGPDDDDQATKYELADDRLGAAGPPVVRDLELGAAGRGVPPQPPLLGPGRVRRDRLRRPRPHRGGRRVGPALVEPAHARPVPGRGARPENRPRRATSGSTLRSGRPSGSR